MLPVGYAILSTLSLKSLEKKSDIEEQYLIRKLSHVVLIVVGPGANFWVK